MAEVLVVVDVQQALVDWLEPQRREEFLESLGALIARARAAHVPLVYIRHQDDELVADSPGWRIARDIAPRPGEPIVEKRFRDAFRQTNLADVLSALRADHLIVCGMQTEYCVDATIREADRRGYRVTLVADGHATFPVDGMSEAQIRDHVHRIANATVAAIVPQAQLFHDRSRTPPVEGAVRAG